jgi:hypothetical protein
MAHAQVSAPSSSSSLFAHCWVSPVDENLIVITLEQTVP